MKLKHLFFDLDRTLWDFDTNSYQELTELYHSYSLHQKGISLPDEFIKVYKKINDVYIGFVFYWTRSFVSGI